MFDALRKMIFPIILIVLVFFVAMIVLEWGLQYGSQNMAASTTVAGKVNGEEISWEEYSRVYSNLVESETRQAQDELPDSRVRELEQAAWQQLVQDRLLQQEVAKHNIVVTEEEVYEYLKQAPPNYLQTIPAFQTNGQFDYTKYRGAMADPQAAPFWAQIEPMVRADLEKMKVQELVIQTVTVTEEEVKNAYLASAERARFGYINVSMAKYSGRPVTPTDEELKAFYDAHQSNYQLGDRRVVNIVRISRGATPADSAAAESRVMALYDSLQAGVDFAALAADHSEDGSAQNGGDLGWISPGQTVTEFDQVAFSLQEGQISRPFRSSFGWHIVKHMGYRDTTVAETKTREAHVAHILVQPEASQNSQEASRSQLANFLTSARNENFDQAAQEAGLKVERSTPFTQEMPIDMLGYERAAIDFAFTNKVGEISEVYENPSYYYVIQVAEEIPAGLASFESVKQRVRMDMIRANIEQMCVDTAQAIHRDIQNGSDLRAAASRHGLEYQVSDWVTRTNFIPELKSMSAAVGAAFALNSAGQVSPATKHAAGAVILQLIERESADLTAYNEKRDSIAATVRNVKVQSMYSRWFEELVKSSKIESNVDRMRQASI